MSNCKDSSAGWRLWLAWMLTSTIGVAAVFALTSAVAMLAGAVLGGGAEDEVPFVPFVGLSFGIMQWLVLRRHIPQAGWWVLASTAGWIAGFGVLAVVFKVVEGVAPGTIEPKVFAAVFFVAVGIAIGMLQWLVLRRHAPQAGWWVLASIVGWAALGLIVGKSLDKATDLIALAAVPPAITGGALVWLLRQTRPVPSGFGHSAI
jgi:hypothetical protein